MSSYLSNLLTHTTSKYNSLRRTLLSSEDDGDTEDDTHICRVLRAYYTEKGRPFPPWLPADPNDRRAVTPQPYTQNSGYFTSAGGKSQYAAVQNSGGSNRGSLSDLWDAPSGGQTSGPMQPQSLRNARRPVAPAQGSSSTLAPPQARPLPSQRAGSYQSMAPQPPSSRPGSAVDPSPPASSGGGSAQERLKARLWGGNRSASPLPGQGANQCPGQNPYDQAGTSGGNPYDSGGRRYGR
ncbi:hypothetical protein M409DRAFT_53444 [Zasmidium cellare ATCC 36951]|uniref:Mso1 N-terminal domain-containing protein n=1 Tax=Zasmidium cellare ATCC 36951 TaxID=1080233 RepID=A0A6A6CPS1_ZASCE|nr:uncharacterized protein M409DRAFT_53444 [Zasmidium cellare ATCC 36951]KAF2168130.1 hypothetical protein M409DRAFT_53444 [Zasmidium cellare ATCC 36951]